MSFPLKFIEKQLTENKLFLDKSPVTRWQFQNLIVKTDRNNNYQITKKQGESVDGVAALTVAMTCFLNDNYNRVGAVLDLFDELSKPTIANLLS